MERSRDNPRREHFSEQSWGDFVRGLAGDIERREMLAHLDSGCQACSKLVAKLELVARVGAHDSSLAIPQEVVKHAQELFQPAPSRSWVDSLTPVLAELISSSRQGWQLAGVRSQSTDIAGDRMLFQAGNYSIDLAVEASPPGQTGEIIGQIANPQDRTERLEGILVQIIAAGRIVGETSTNRFGEFIIDVPAKKPATLHLALKHRGQRIDLPLKLSETP